MEVTRTAYGTWNGGRFMNYGEALPDERWIGVVQHAYRRGLRTFMTADVYGSGGADELLGRALAGGSTRRLRAGALEFGFWNLFGIWSLGFGISAKPPRISNSVG